MIEDLTVRNMSRSASGTLEAPGKNVRAKAGLNKSILDQGWFEFRRQLAYKLAWPGGNLLVIPPQYTSQTCSRYHALRAHFAIENICRSDTLACRLPLEASAFRGGRQMTHRKGITQRRIWGAVKHASPVSVNIQDGVLRLSSMFRALAATSSGMTRSRHCGSAQSARPQGEQLSSGRNSTCSGEG